MEQKIGELEMDKSAFETKIVDLTVQLSEVSGEFDRLKQQHVRMLQSLDESVQTANAKQHKIEQLQDELAIAGIHVRLSKTLNVLEKLLL